MLMRSNDTRPAEVFGVLDIGTSKTVCLVVAPGNTRGALWRRQGASILGFGHAPTLGLKAGVVIDVDAAEHSVRAAVAQAEQAAGVSLDEVCVAVTGGGMRSQTFEADTRIQGSVVGADIDRLMAAGRRYADRDGRVLLHMSPIGYRLDGSDRVRDALGLRGRTLAAELHSVTADDGPLGNLLQAVEQSDLVVTEVAPAAYASGLATTTEEERHQGVMCVDMGAGTTTLSMFDEGSLRAVDTLAVGGHHVTFDIARSLSTPFEDAERIKTQCGTLDAAASEDQGMVACTLAEEEEAALHHITNAQLHGIIGTRVAGLLAHVVERTAHLGVGHFAAKGVVLTGGASELPGLSDFAERILARPVRVAGPVPAPGLPDDCCRPAFAAAVGLVQLALDRAAGGRRRRHSPAVEAPGYLKRVGQWLLDGA
jgi:cell division protein FtsA